MASISGAEATKSRPSDWFGRTIPHTPCVKCQGAPHSCGLQGNPESLLPRDHHHRLMPKGAASKDKKSAEKKGGDKGKGKSEEAADKGGKVRTSTASIHPRLFRAPRSYFFFFLSFFCADADRTSFLQGKGGLKAATAVNVRHILCEKHSKATEALERIQVTYRCPSISCESISFFSPSITTVVSPSFRRAVRPESDLTKLRRNVRRTRPRVRY